LTVERVFGYGGGVINERVKNMKIKQTDLPTFKKLHKKLQKERDKVREKIKQLDLIIYSGGLK
jgi:hypothetical protein